MAEQDPLEDVLGPAANALAALAPVLREKVLTGLESLTGQRPSLDEVSFSAADAAGVEAEFSALDHVASELTVTLPGGEQHLGVAIVALSDLGGMLGIETGAERMADEDFARAQLEMISAATREFFDLMSLTLFIDDLQGIEIVPGNVQVGAAGATAALAAEAAAGVPLVRVDIALGVGGQPARVVLLLPQAFLDALGAGAVVADPLDEIVSATTSVEGARDEVEDTGAFDNISTLRPAGTFGAGAREDVDVHPVRFPPLSDVSPAQAERRSLDLIMDVSMRVTVELGRSTLTVEEVLSLGPGSVVELNKLAGEPVDVLVNDQLIARGEVVVVDENFGVRVTEIVSPRRRAQAMGA